jgi:hypothetical protein
VTEIELADRTISRQSTPECVIGMRKQILARQAEIERRRELIYGRTIFKPFLDEYEKNQREILMKGSHVVNATK